MRNQVYQTIAHALKQHLSGSLDGGKLQHLIEYTYLPILHWTNTLFAQKQSKGDHHCVVIGLSCVQGGGKTTACRILKTALNAIGRKCAVISLDDVYLTFIDQLHVAKENSANPLLQVYIRLSGLI
uniref:Uncharacterized protein ALNC14_008770 n=1 Tax=Albugo laibachii Nc14 TaxID=890382 RepID=F0W110_9STRA|nr:unnamed protein product [Albugo laibachii Nc14]|eukprot:CCA14734.1 unnamed protein product [Albugo laibachii Nc14]